MTFKKPDTSYWDRKFIAYMHDPLDKVFRIQGHEARAAAFLEKYGLQMPNEEYWKTADAIAAGFERGQVPSYSPQPNENGAVDFLKNPIITHPTSKKTHVHLSIPDESANTAKNISEALISFIETDIGIKPGHGGYSDEFEEESEFAVARFLYTHLILRFKLSAYDIGGLGGFWHRVPADSRFPDHSIWQHNALCSALSSCLELVAGNASDIGLMVFSITPVQAFISKARKLRDYWTGSILLSWLAFEGMKWVMENLGPDHILYPSLIDQPLVNEYMKKYWKVTDEGFLNPPKDIASFPNKFLFLIPMNDAEEIAGQIKHQIRASWRELYETICNTTILKMGDFLSDDQKTFIAEMFQRQNSHFWDLQWAAARLVDRNDRLEIEELLPESTYTAAFSLLENFNRMIADKPHYNKSGRGALYSVSHSLAQTTLAVSKTRKIITRMPETGEKCHLCGEFEVMHHKKFQNDTSAGEYKNGVNEFWRYLKKQWDGEGQNSLGHNLKENEKLCSICLIKRMAYEAMKNNTGHMLQSVFKDKHSFPSSTEIALTTYFDRKNIPEAHRKATAQRVHDSADEKTDNHDRYFAILMMDGDKMGKLVNGETLGSTWESVMHPDIVTRIKNPDFKKIYHDNWQEIFGEKRLVTPAVHAAISECLGDFSLYGVPGIIKKYKGTLIYAGGDDVCAVLPVETAFDAAREIKEYYVSTFKLIQKESPPEDVVGSWPPKPGKLSINLGKGDAISISAGILICHHKESLTQMIEEAHYLLDEKAKNEAGRNACAIELRKRSGGSRFFLRKWSDSKAWESFASIGNAIKNKNKIQVSTSVVYRLEQLRAGIDAILKQDDWRDMLIKLILKQLERSSVGDEEYKTDFAKKIVDIVISENHKNDRQYDPNGLIVAAFMAAKGGEDNELV